MSFSIETVWNVEPQDQPQIHWPHWTAPWQNVQVRKCKILLKPIGDQCNFRLSKGFTQLSRESIIYGVICSLYNSFHPKFFLKFISQEEQEHFANLLRKRCLAYNPMTAENLGYGVNVQEFPSDDDPDWESIAMEELDQRRKDWNLPTLIQNTEKEKLADKALNNLALGNYRWLRGSQYIVHLKQYEVLEEEEGTYEDAVQLVGEMYKNPKKSRLYHYFQSEEPSQWNESDFGPWPRNGAHIFGASFASANRSNTTK